ncbi:type III polyketide synthase BpsA [soil metagenome]
MNEARIAGIGTALPEHIVTQDDVRAVVGALFGDRFSQIERILQVFEHDHIRTRRFVRPISWYAEQHGFRDCNNVYIETATDLATLAATRAIEGSGHTAQEISAIVFVSTTGIATPSIESTVLQRLQCAATTSRIPIVGLGCAGGVVGLARAAEICRARNGAPVLLIAAEICSVTFQRGEPTKSNIVASSIFGDGAAAVVISGSGQGPRVGHGYSELFPNTADIMGWDVIDTGLNVRFSRDIPDFVRTNMADVLDRFLTHTGLEKQQISTFVAHPGGAKVLDAYADVLGVPSVNVEMAKDVLREVGNISSASVLFVLGRELRQHHEQGSLGLCLALGPGFSAEFCTLEWT